MIIISLSFIFSLSSFLFCQTECIFNLSRAVFSGWANIELLEIIIACLLVKFVFVSFNNAVIPFVRPGIKLVLFSA